MARLVRAGIPVLSQTVLLRGVNDDAAVLEALFRGLVAMRVKPYYLHHADLAPRHRRISAPGSRRGSASCGALRGRVSGLCQPTYVLDIPGGYGKVPIGPALPPDPSADGVEDTAGWRLPADPERTADKTVAGSRSGMIAVSENSAGPPHRRDI